MAMGFLKSKLPLLIGGLILGISLYLGPSLILSILILWSIFFFLAKRPGEDKNSLTKIVVIALVLRLLFFALAIYIVYCANVGASQYPNRIVGHTVQAVRDFDREIKNGFAIARYLKGEFGNIPVKEISHHGVGFLHAGAWTQGILNFIFGVSIFNLLLFPLIDLWTVIIVYYLAKLLFDGRTASFASFIYAIMPSTIFISCTNIRFSLSIFSLLLIAFAILQFARRNNLRSLLLLAIGVIIFIVYREKASRPLLMVLPLILFFAFNIRFRTKFTFLATLAGFFILLLFKSSFVQQKSVELLQNIFASQVGFTSEAGGGGYSDYMIFDEVIYRTDIKAIPPSTLIKMLPMGLFKGIVYFMFVPFPWEVTNTARLYFYPQVIFWYFIFPFAILGILKSLFFKAKEALPIVILCGYFIVLLSLVLGNEGIAVRYRELITPFFYIFAGSILCNLFAPRGMKGYRIS